MGSPSFPVTLGSSHDLQRAAEAPTKPPSCGATFPRRAFFGAPFLYVLMRRRIIVHLYCRHDGGNTSIEVMLVFYSHSEDRWGLLFWKQNGENVWLCLCVLNVGIWEISGNFLFWLWKKNSSFCWIVVFDVRKFFCLYPPRSPTIWVFPKMVVPKTPQTGYF